jgi:hypothetical protein
LKKIDNPEKLEYYRNDLNVDLPPLNLLLARRLIEKTRVSKVLQGYRNIPPANLDRLSEILVRVSQLVTDCPEITELDINPLSVIGGRFVAVDAIGNIPLFVSLVEGVSKAQRRKIISDSVITATVVAKGNGGEWRKEDILDASTDFRWQITAGKLTIRDLAGGSQFQKAGQYEFIINAAPIRPASREFEVASWFER